MAMTTLEKLNRKWARDWGKSAINNLNMALWSTSEADSWAKIAERVRQRFNVGSDEDAQSAIEHAEGRAKYNRELADHQTEQVFINARRAFREAIKARDGGN